MYSLTRLAAVLVALSSVKSAEFSDLSDNRNIIADTDKFVKVCGPELANALAGVCNSVYNGKRNSMKRGNALDDADEPDYFHNYDTFMDLGIYPFRTKRSVASVLRNIRTKRDTKVVDECCRKPCRIQEMMGYCG